MILYKLIDGGNYKLSIVYNNFGRNAVILEYIGDEDDVNLCRYFEESLYSTYEINQIYEKYKNQTNSIFIEEIKDADIPGAINRLDDKISKVYNTKEFYNELEYLTNAMKIAKAVLKGDIDITEYDVCYKDIDFSKELGGLKK